MLQLGVRVTAKGVVRHGMNTILPVLLSSHAASGRLIAPKLSLVSSPSRGPKARSVRIFWPKSVTAIVAQGKELPSREYTGVGAG